MSGGEHGTPAPAPATPAGSATPRTQSMPGLQGHWQRLHPLSPIVRAGRGLIPIGFIILVPAYGNQHGSGNTLEHAGIVLVAFILGLISWLVTRWRVEGDVLRVDSGLLRRSSERFPLGQVQAIDVVRPGLARMFGLAELRVRVAGGTRKAGRLAYLMSPDADALRERLLEMRAGRERPANAPPEETLLTVSPRLLLVSLTLTGPGLVLEAVLAGLVALAILAPAAATATISAGTGGLIGVVVAAFRRFNAGYRLTVADAPDGLRVRSGLVETTAETIPRGRIQALRMTQPLAWRPLGWCRLEVDVAVQKSKGRQDRDAARAARFLLPVGTRAQALSLVAQLLGEVPSAGSRPPTRARVKSPLRFRNLSWSAGGACAVATSGRVRLVTDWVPLSKVQSIRQVEGPLQRALRLSSVHLDTAGRNVHAVARDRDHDEVAHLLRELPDRCRQARQRESRVPAGASRPGLGPALPVSP